MENREQETGIQQSVTKCPGQVSPIMITSTNKFEGNSISDLSAHVPNLQKCDGWIKGWKKVDGQMDGQDHP